MPDRVRDACVACFEVHRNDCSGFVHAVSEELGVEMTGLANDMVDILRKGGDWVRLLDGPAAARAASDGKLVVAGLKGSEQTVPNMHGHVVVVIGGPLAHDRYPAAYWGSLGGTPGHDQTLNFAWTAADRDRVSYAAHELSAAS